MLEVPPPGPAPGRFQVGQHRAVDLGQLVSGQRTSRTTLSVQILNQPLGGRHQRRCQRIAGTPRRRHCAAGSFATPTRCGGGHRRADHPPSPTLRDPTPPARPTPWRLRRHLAPARTRCRCHPGECRTGATHLRRRPPAGTAPIRAIAGPMAMPTRRVALAATNLDHGDQQAAIFAHPDRVTPETALVVESAACIRHPARCPGRRTNPTARQRDPRSQ